MSLTLEEANRIIRGALAKADELNIKISAAVCDAGGRPLAFQRMDGAIWASAYACQGKAVAAAAFGRPSGEMAERADHPQRGCRRRLRGRRRHLAAGRRLRPRRRLAVVEARLSAVALAPRSGQTRGESGIGLPVGAVRVRG